MRSTVITEFSYKILFSHSGKDLHVCLPDCDSVWTYRDYEGLIPTSPHIHTTQKTAAEKKVFVMQLNSSIPYSIPLF